MPTAGSDDVTTGPVGRVAELPPVYRDIVAASADNTMDAPVEASVIIVTYNTSRADVESALRPFDEQTTDHFEVIVVDNGNNWPVGESVQRFDRVTAYVRLDRNRGVTVGRNLGARVAASDLIVFLDDDAVPAEDFVAAHRRVHDEEDVLGVRGRVRTTEDTFYNRQQTWYDLGPEPVPYHLNTEGNSSYDRETFLSHGGFDDGLTGRAGHEGIDLTYRLVTDGFNRDRFIYHPDPVIYHDIDSDPLSYLRKHMGRRYCKRRLLEHRTGLAEFLASYETPDGEDGSTETYDRLFARAFSISSRVGCRLLELRDEFGGTPRFDTKYPE